MKDKRERILESVEKENVKFVNLEFTDMLGAIKSVTIPIAQLSDSLHHGTWFDGSSIIGFARIAESDMYLMPDPETYAILPWEPKEKTVARFICDVYKPDGKPFEGDPRYILKKTVEEANKMNFTYNTGPELEFFLFKPNDELVTKPVPHDVGSYFDFSPKDLAAAVRSDVISSLQALGMYVEMSHHEVAYGQHEIDFRYADALKTADNAITFKHTVKAIAHLHGLYATFMPKPVFGINGSGMHVHQSLFDRKGKNTFFDPNNSYKLSEVARRFIAGQITHMKAITAILAPTVNSYKRLVPGYEAPVYISWAGKNRSALIRVPAYSTGREQSMRAELRCPDPSCNPYLAFAVMLKAGLDGIKRKLEPPKPVEEDVYEFNNAKLKSFYIETIPASLEEAIIEYEKSKLVEDTLGEHLFKEYLKAKKAEWNDYKIQVTPWELQKYLESL